MYCSCQSSENHLKTLDQDTDEEIVKHHVQLEEIVIVRGNILRIPEGQHHRQVEDDRQDCGDHVSYHH